MPLPKEHPKIPVTELEFVADKLFTCCLQFLIGKEEQWLTMIRDLSQELLDRGYETNFQHKKKALVVRTLLKATEREAGFDDKLGPKLADVRELPHAE